MKPKISVDLKADVDVAGLLLYGDEHEVAGRASRLRNDHRNRSGGVAAQGTNLNAKQCLNLKT